MSDQELFTIYWFLFTAGWWYSIPLFLGFPENMYNEEEDLWF